MQSMTPTLSAPRVDTDKLAKHSNKLKSRQRLVVRSTWTALYYYAALCRHNTVAFGPGHGSMGKSCPRVANSRTSSNSDSSPSLLRFVANRRTSNGDQMTRYYSSKFGCTDSFSTTPMPHWSIKTSLSNTFFRPSNFCPTRTHKSYLSYRSKSDYAEAEPAKPFDIESQLSTRWWRSDVSSSINSGENDAEQYVLDDYLEFLDKRYHRVHDSEIKDQRPRIDTAWKWLFNSTSTFESSQGNHQDALYALGVANLASNRLLQKYQSSRKSAIEVPVETRILSDRVMRVVAPLEVLAMSSVNIIRRVGTCRSMALANVKRALMDAVGKCAKNATVRLEFIVRRRLKRVAYLGAVLVGISTVLVIKPLLAIATSNP